MGDKRRFDLFAKFISHLVPPSIRGDVRVADVAAGKGILSWALIGHGFRRITPFEPYPRRGGQVTRLGIRVYPFEPSMASDYDLIVGMHPDAATDCILSGAAIHKKMAVISPCCTRPCAWTYWGSKTSSKEWIAHLIKRSEEAGLVLSHAALNMNGANTVLFGGEL